VLEYLKTNEVTSKSHSRKSSLKSTLTGAVNSAEAINLKKNVLNKKLFFMKTIFKSFDNNVLSLLGN